MFKCLTEEKIVVNVKKNLPKVNLTQENKKTENSTQKLHKQPPLAKKGVGVKKKSLENSQSVKTKRDFFENNFSQGQNISQGSQVVVKPVQTFNPIFAQIRHTANGKTGHGLGT